MCLHRRPVRDVHNMGQVFVHDLSYALGDKKTHVTESENAGWLYSSAADLISAGFEWHYICEPGATAYALAKAAATQMGDHVIAAGADAIIYATCLPLNGNNGDGEEWRSSRDVTHLMRFPASDLQRDLSLGQAIAVGLNQQGCTGMLGSLRLARALLTDEPDWNRVLCVTADRFPEGSIYEQAYNLVSDAAAACMVTRERRGFRLVAAHHITNGGLSEATHDERVGTYFSYTNRLVQETLRRAGCTPSDVDWIVPQNTNQKAWQIMSRLLGVDVARVWQSSIRDIGHAISADNVINLTALVQSGQVKPGNRVLLLMAGHGLNWQSVLLEATEDVR